MFAAPSVNSRRKKKKKKNITIILCQSLSRDDSPAGAKRKKTAQGGFFGWRWPGWSVDRLSFQKGSPQKTEKIVR
jgi:hypothetical protein